MVTWKETNVSSVSLFYKMLQINLDNMMRCMIERSKQCVVFDSENTQTGRLFSTAAGAIWSLDCHFAIDAKTQTCMHAGNK